MEDFLTIAVLVLYFVFAASGQKNKKKKKKKSRAAQQRRAEFDQAFEQYAGDPKISSAREAVNAVPDVKKNAGVQTGEGNDPCHEFMLPPSRPSIRLESVTQTEMSAAGEGMDPCHPGAAPDDAMQTQESPVYQSPIFDFDDPQALSRDMVRGVVMSEILSRPQRRGYHRNLKRRA